MPRLTIKPNRSPKHDTVIIVTKGIKPQKANLTARQRAFVEHYLVSRNATDAARKAGYAHGKCTRVQASRLLINTIIRQEIDKRQTKQADKLEVTAERIQAEIAKMAFMDMRHYLDANGLPLSDFSGLPPEHTAAIRSITVEEFKDGRSDKREVRRLKFTLGDKEKALEMLAKRFGMLIDKHEHTHQHTVLGVLLHEIDEESRGAIVNGSADPQR